MKLKPQRSSVIFLALLLVFLAPGLLALWAYQHPEPLTRHSTNQGRLLQPVWPLPELGEERKWQLLLWSPQNCDQSCQQDLDRLARVRLALGRRLYQVQLRLLLGSEAPALPAALVQRLKDQDLRVTVLTAQAFQALRQAYPASKIFIANPKHELILLYDQEASSEAVYHDFKTLLSQG